MSLILKLYLFMLNAGIVGFAYFIDRYVSVLTKRLSDTVIWISRLDEDVESLQEAVLKLQQPTATRRKTTTKQG